MKPQTPLLTLLVLLLAALAAAGCQAGPTAATPATALPSATAVPKTKTPEPPPTDEVPTKPPETLDENIPEDARRFAQEVLVGEDKMVPSSANLEFVGNHLIWMFLIVGEPGQEFNSIQVGDGVKPDAEGSTMPLIFPLPADAEPGSTMAFDQLNKAGIPIVINPEGIVTHTWVAEQQSFQKIDREAGVGGEMEPVPLAPIQPEKPAPTNIKEALTHEAFQVPEDFPNYEMHFTESGIWGNGEGQIPRPTKFQLYPEDWAQFRQQTLAIGRDKLPEDIKARVPEGSAPIFGYDITTNAPYTNPETGDPFFTANENTKFIAIADFPMQADWGIDNKVDLSQYGYGKLTLHYMSGGNDKPGYWNNFIIPGENTVITVTRWAGTPEVREMIQSGDNVTIWNFMYKGFQSTAFDYDFQTWMMSQPPRVNTQSAPPELQGMLREAFVANHEFTEQASGRFTDENGNYMGFIFE